jgi:hypothetical protein
MKPQTNWLDTESIAWERVEDGAEGLFEKILCRDPVTGSYTRLLKFDAGVEFNRTLEHDFYEEIFVLKGIIINLLTNSNVEEGFYCFRHPYMKHGHFRTPNGAILLEIRTYP